MTEMLIVLALFTLAILGVLAAFAVCLSRITVESEEDQAADGDGHHDRSDDCYIPPVARRWTYYSFGAFPLDE